MTTRDLFPTTPATCTFCRIARRELPADLVHETAEVLAFLDHRPLFPGHTLVVPRNHIDTLADLPPALLTAVFTEAQRLAVAVEKGLGAEGSFVANNNRVSQSVPHFHVHVIPRSHGDGLKGFFWPRHGYRDDAHRLETAERIRNAVGASSAAVP